MNAVFEERKELVIGIINRSYSEEDLASINRFYESTKMGYFISSAEGFKKLGEALEKSGYMKGMDVSIETVMEDMEGRTKGMFARKDFKVLLEYAEKTLSGDDLEGYLSFKILLPEIGFLQDRIL